MMRCERMRKERIRDIWRRRFVYLRESHFLLFSFKRFLFFFVLFLRPIKIGQGMLFFSISL